MLTSFLILWVLVSITIRLRKQKTFSDFLLQVMFVNEATGRGSDNKRIAFATMKQDLLRSRENWRRKEASCSFSTLRIIRELSQDYSSPNPIAVATRIHSNAFNFAVVIKNYCAIRSPGNFIRKVAALAKSALQFFIVINTTTETKCLREKNLNSADGVKRLRASECCNFVPLHKIHSKLFKVFVSPRIFPKFSSRYESRSR